jgi:hypothetical protein
MTALLDLVLESYDRKPPCRGIPDIQPWLSRRLVAAARARPSRIMIRGRRHMLSTWTARAS